MAGLADEGKPVVVSEPGSPAGRALTELAEQLVKQAESEEEF
jgi:hypothetical protein